MRLFYYARTYYGGCLGDIVFKSYLKLKREDFSSNTQKVRPIFLIVVRVVWIIAQV